jgi:hypothetical protein
VFDPGVIIEELDRHGAVFARLLAGKPASAVVWRPQPAKWNLLDIVCHLVDEEREDFRARTRHALESRPGLPAPIDPEGWVTARQYAAQGYESKLAGFIHERAASVAWLRSLQAPDWDAGFEHPQLGFATARLFLSNWLAHDLLHIRQIVRLEYERLGSGGDRLHYAGPW